MIAYRIRFWSLVSLFALVCSPPAFGQSVYTWNGNGYYWHTANNWNPAGGPPGVNDTAVFNPHTVPAFEPFGATLIGDQVIGSVRMGLGRQGGGRFVDGYGTLTVGSATSTGITALNPGEFRFNATLSGASATNTLRLNLHSGAQFSVFSPMVTNIGPVTLHEGNLTIHQSGGPSANLFSDTALILANGGRIDMNLFNAGQSETLGPLAVQSGNVTVNMRWGGTSLTLSGIDFAAGSGRGTVNFTGYQGSASPSNPLGENATNRRIFLTGVSAGNLSVSATVNGTDYARYTVENGVQIANYTFVGNTLSGGNASDFHSLGQSTTNATVTNTFTSRGLKISPNGAGRTLDLTGAAALNTTGLLLVGSDDYTIRGLGTGTITGGGPRYFAVANANTTLNLAAQIGSAGSDVVKTGEGIVSLTGNNGAILNTGNTRFVINAGVLRTTVGATGGLPSNNNVSVDLRGGVLEISGGSNGTGVNADFTRSLGDTSTTGGRVSWSNSPADRGGGGFSAFGSDASVNIGGSATPDALRWGQMNFLQEGSALRFGSVKSNHAITFFNPIQLDEAGNSLYSVREVNVVRADTGNPNAKAVLAGVISGTANVDLIKTGNGTLELTADNTYAGSTFILGGRLRVGNGGTTGSIGTSGRIQNQAELEFNRAGTLTVNQQIAGTGSLRVTGPGTITLTQDNPFTGGTTVTNGRLVITTPTGSGLGNNGVSVSGGTLDGVGRIGTSVGVGGTGSLSAGTGGSATDRRLDLGNTLTMSGNSLFVAQLFGTGANDVSRVHTAGGISIVNNPFNTVTMRLALAGVTVEQLRAAGPQQFIVLSTDGTIGGSFALTDFTTAGFLDSEWQLIQTNNTVVLSFTPVPEPGSMLAVVVTALAVAAGVRRFRSSLARRGAATANRIDNAITVV